MNAKAILVTGSSGLDEARKGDHICYISDFRKFKTHYPNWKISRPLDDILKEIIAAEGSRTAASSSASR